ncbi:MAG: tetratricopeptide repeat protein [Hyphomicrobiaceae bacterium]
MPLALTPKRYLAILLAGLVCVTGASLAPGVPAERGESAEAADFATIHDRAASDYMKGEMDRALAGFNAAIALNPASALAYYNRGNVYYAKGDYIAAVRDFTEALRISPGLPYANMNRGNALSNLGRLDEALNDLDEAVRLQPDVSDSYFNRAIVHVRRRELEQALADYERAISRDAEDQEAAAARQRLVDLLGGARDGGLATVDTAKIATEIAHARQVEHLLRLVANTCIAHGESLEGLKTLALVGKWKPAPNEDLTRRSGAVSHIDGGWTFHDRFGAYALVHSESNHKPPVYVCSLTTQPVSPHLVDDVKAGFEARFGVAPHDTPAWPGQQVTRYQLSHGKDSLLAALAFTPKHGALTFRIYLGNP